MRKHIYQRLVSEYWKAQARLKGAPGRRQILRYWATGRGLANPRWAAPTAFRRTGDRGSAEAAQRVVPALGLVQVGVGPRAGTGATVASRMTPRARANVSIN
jgi:hypothetical protein